MPRAADLSPRVSVVIPTYQRSDLVGRAIASVLAQQGPSFEVVVVDDGSTDSTPDVLSAIADPRVRVVRQANAGRGAARNAGLRVARGELVTFLDSDDEALPGWLAEVDRLADTDRVPVVRLAVRRDTGGTIEHLAAAALDPDRPYPEGTMCAGSYAVATEVLREVGGFDPGLEYAENTELLLRLGLAARRDGWCSAVSDVEGLCWHRQTFPDRGDRYASAPRQAAEELLARYADVLRDRPDIRRDYRAIVGTDELRQGHRWRAARWFVSSWAADPSSARAAARMVGVALPARLRSRLAGWLGAPCPGR
jgi:glycosyltransferase involved in cell wall biosynthesis